MKASGGVSDGGSAAVADIRDHTVRSRLPHLNTLQVSVPWSIRWPVLNAQRIHAARWRPSSLLQPSFWGIDEVKCRPATAKAHALELLAMYRKRAGRASG